jgi:hypothetical protein
MLALLAFSDCNQLVASADDYFLKTPSFLSLFEKNWNWRFFDSQNIRTTLMPFEYFGTYRLALVFTLRIL